MIILLILVIIVLTIIYTFLRLDNDKVRENFESSDKKEKKENRKKMKLSCKRNFIENFLAFPNKQRYCPNLYKSKAKVWSKLPPKYGKGLFVKYNCTVCYYKIFRNIVCRKNQGRYKIDKMSKSDLDVFEKYYNDNKKKLDFTYDRFEFEKYIGKRVLKYKKDDIYYPIQILKTRDDMDFKDIIDDDVYRTDFKCKKIKKKPVVKEKKDSDSENDSEENDSEENNSEENKSNNKDKKKEEGIFSFFDLL